MCQARYLRSTLSWHASGTIGSRTTLWKYRVKEGVSSIQAVGLKHLILHHTYSSARLSSGARGSQRTAWSLKQIGLGIKLRGVTLNFPLGTIILKWQASFSAAAEQNQMEVHKLCPFWLSLMNVAPEDPNLRSLPSVLVHQEDPEHRNKTWETIFNHSMETRWWRWIYIRTRGPGLPVKPIGPEGPRMASWSRGSALWPTNI